MNEARRNPVDELAEEFVERYRRGERPGLTEYTDKRPELAKDIRELFPALIMIEEAGPAESQPLFGGSGQVTAAGQTPQQLGDYRIVRQIGRGGMGVVFEAVQEALGRHVALKVLPLAFAKEPIHLKRFIREARSAARLHHTNIVPVFDVGEWQGIHYYAMQFIQGQGLDEVWQELRRMRGLPHRCNGNTPGQADTDPFPQAALESGLSFQLATGMRTGQFATDQPDEDGPRIEDLSGEPASMVEDRGSMLGAPSASSSGFSREEKPPIGGTANSPSSILDSPSWTGASGSSLVGGSSEFQAQTDYHFYRSVARVGLQVAEALAYAHHHKVLHRDIKPSNLLLDRQGTVWVTDFGLAKEEECEDLTRTGDIVGTLRYMAPERLNGTADPRSDIYGLGMTLYELLTLQPVFPERDRARLMQQIMRESPARPRKLDSRIPRDLETIVCKAIAKEPRDRYPTAEALAEDLSRFLADRPIKARRSSAGELVWRWCRRNPAGGLAAVATAAMIITLALALWFVSRSRDDAIRSEQKALGLAAEKEKLADTERSLRKQAEWDAAKLSFEQAYTKCFQEDAGRGMLWLSHSLAVAHQARDDELESAIRYQLAAWSRYVHPLMATFRHRGVVLQVAFSPDGKIIVTASMDATAQLWETATGKPLGPPLKHDGPVRAVAFSPDGKSVLTGSDDQTAQLWEVATGKPLGPPLKHQGSIYAVAFSPPDGKYVITAGFNETAKVWDAKTGEPVGKPMPHSGPVLAATFSPDGKMALTGGLENKARLWEVPPTGKPKYTIDVLGPTSRVAFSPDGKRALTTGGFNAAQLWEVATGKAVGPPLHHESVVENAVFSPDGKIVATGSHDETARLWEVSTGKLLAPPLRHQSYVPALAFSPDGRILLSGSWDDTARLWDVPSGKPVGPPLRHHSAVVTVAFSPDGKTVLTGGYDLTARLWRLENGKTVGQPIRHQARLRPLAFSPDGKSVLTGSQDRVARLWELATTKPVNAPLPQPGPVMLGVISPDGKAIVTVSYDVNARGHAEKKAQVWDAITGKPIGSPFQHEHDIHALAFSPDGRKLVTGSGDTTAQVWDVKSGKAIGPPLKHPQPVLAVAFAPDSETVLTGCGDTLARVWDIATGKPIREFKHQGPVGAVAFSPDGRTALTASEDRSAQLWDVAAGRRRCPPLQHQGIVGAVAFSPDGKMVLTGSRDTTARIWEVGRGKAVGPPLQHQGIVSVVAFSPDGKTVLTASEDHMLRRWEIPSPLTGDVEQVKLWTEVLTGMELEKDETVRVLYAHEWEERRQLLKDLEASQEPMAKR